MPRKEDCIKIYRAVCPYCGIYHKDLIEKDFDEYDRPWEPIVCQECQEEF